MRSIVRVKFEDPRDEWDILFIDLVIDEANRIVIGGPLCGWWGSIKSTDLMPFVAKPKADGSYVIDFGSDDETDQTERLHALTLPGDRIRPGCSLSFIYDGDVVSLKASKVTDMIDGRSVD